MIIEDRGDEDFGDLQSGGWKNTCSISSGRCLKLYDIFEFFVVVVCSKWGIWYRGGKLPLRVKQ